MPSPLLELSVILMAAAGLWLTWRLWRGPVPEFARPHWMWLWGEALWKGTLRSIPLWTSLFVLGAALPVGSSVDAALGNHWFTGVVLVLFAAWLVLFCTVPLFNRPKFIVPPHLRQEPGAIEEWWRAERRARPNARLVPWLATNLLWGAAYFVLMAVLVFTFLPRVGVPMTWVIGLSGVAMLWVIQQALGARRRKRKR